MTTEFLHCQDDGGAASVLTITGNLVVVGPFIDGFLWAMVDEGLTRTDMNGFIDTDGVNWTRRDNVLTVRKKAAFQL
jgi:hypothetical protein